MKRWIITKKNMEQIKAKEIINNETDKIKTNR